MTTVEYFQFDLKLLGFKKKGNHFFRKYEFGTQFVTFDRAGQFDRYYMNLGIKYEAIELSCTVRDAMGCPIQAEVLDIARSKGYDFKISDFSSNINPDIIEPIRKLCLPWISDWFEKWSDPKAVEKWIRSEFEGNKITTITISARKLWGLPLTGRILPDIEL